MNSYQIIFKPSLLLHGKHLRSQVTSIPYQFLVFFTGCHAVCCNENYCRLWTVVIVIFIMKNFIFEDVQYRCVHVYSVGGVNDQGGSSNVQK